ncbi:MAG: hypothetical protein ABIT96_11235 [Ferruginibacter sp.]
MRMIKTLMTALVVFALQNIQAQETKTNTADSVKDLSMSGLKFRSVGPALTSGRIIGIAVNPNNKAEYFAASGHGSLWKTSNNGASWKAVFDGQKSYSIGAVTLAPSNSNIVWVGTGENNNQNNVIYGDGVYKSEDGGKSWKNMGLKNSSQVGGIVIDPADPQTVYVAAYGSLRTSGGERGIYKTTDGGKTWRQSLYVSPYTGFFEIHMSPANSKILYAVAHQRQRNLYSGVRGGPETAIYRSLDSGATWVKSVSGLPAEDMGRIGLAISPVKPDILYAIVEAKDAGGFYKSTDMGASWTKQSSYVSAYPFYMNKIFADPADVDVVYSMDVQNKVTRDGGKTWTNLGENFKHVDNHWLYIDPQNTQHMLSGCDGGVYETWDGAKAWDFKANLPIAEIYKVSTDNALPFYNVYAGTQDNSSFGGPSRTLNSSGITNSDWFFTTGGDGFETQVDWKDENIIYAQSQNGGLVRFDRKSGERLSIRPMELIDSGYRFDWSSPLLISQHNNNRLYFGANKIFRTNDQGSTWDLISPDLTRGVPSKMQKLMNRSWSIDELANKGSMGQITTIAESPLDQNLIYSGSGDGLLYITTNGGQSWLVSGSLPGLPEYARVSSIALSNFSKNVAYVACENFNGGIYKPYLFKTSDGGKSWTNLNGNLPDLGSTYAIAEDFVNPSLLFAGTQFGAWYSVNGGTKWVQLKNGIPPQAVTDIDIQKRESDLVISTFGRGIFIMDDYSALRSISKENTNKDAYIFPVKDALMYIEARPFVYRGKGFQGESFFTTPNPEPGAVLTYFIKNDYKSLEKRRRDFEKEKQKKGEDIDIPVFDSLRKEQNEIEPYLLFTIKDNEGNIVRRLRRNINQGVNRVTWDFRYPSTQPISISNNEEFLPWSEDTKGFMAAPGMYTVSLSKFDGKSFIDMNASQKFKIVPLNNKSISGGDMAAMQVFNKKVAELGRSVNGADAYINDLQKKIPYYKKAVLETPGMPADSYQKVLALENKLKETDRKLNGDNLRARYESVTPISLRGRIGNISGALMNSTVGPTVNQQQSLDIVTGQFEGILSELKSLGMEVDALERDLEKYHAPYTPGRLPIWNK